MTLATPYVGDDEVTTELPVTTVEAATAVATTPETPAIRERRIKRPKRSHAPRDVYQRRRETAAAALLVAGGALIWTQIGESVTALLRR